METIYNEHIKQIRLALDFNQRYMRDRIRVHKRVINGIAEDNFLVNSVPLLQLDDDELVAYDEYLNCYINMYHFGEILRGTNRFTECCRDNG